MAGFRLLSMARQKAAVFPVPDWDWAIRFWGLRAEKHTEGKDSHTRSDPKE